jgi:ABC-type antimicrobial peptide transport system permease subunit
LIRPIGFGLLAGSGLAAGVAIVLISTPFAAGVGNTIHVLDPVAYVASILVIVTASIVAASIPAWRAARLDPIATLRQD